MSPSVATDGGDAARLQSEHDWRAMSPVEPPEAVYLPWSTWKITSAISVLSM
jgi:hypothetical protein